MEKVKSISHLQLFSMMFVSTVFFSMMYSVYIMGNMSLLTYALSAVAAGVCMFLVTLPLVGFRKKFDEGNIVKSVQVTKPALSPIFAYLYGHCFIYSSVISLAVFALLISNFINSDISFIVFLAVTVVCCYYAGSRGIVSIARSGSLFLLLTVVSLLFIGTSLSYKINILNYSEIYLTSARDIVSNTMLLIGQAFCVPAVFLFSHQTRGSLGKSIRLWAVLSYVAVAVIGFVSYGVLGEYLHLTPFPFYTAAQLTEIGAFQRLDALFLAVVTIGLFINVSLSMYALRETVQSSMRAEKAKFINPLSAVSVGVLAWLTVKFDWLRSYLLDARVMLIVFLTVAVVLPVVALLLLTKKHIPQKAAKVGAVLTLAMLFIPMLTGCGSVQLEERMLIKGIGVDATNSGYSLTIQYIDKFSDDEGQSN
ncbi:MAG: spore germination protein, partial [Lachnospiraceae bacterium]|nr:spore germination protein [Lachnospiraceae bacterium]